LSQIIANANTESFGICVDEKQLTSLCMQ